jgi:hypothetical protein
MRTQAARPPDADADARCFSGFAFGHGARLQSYRPQHSILLFGLPPPPPRRRRLRRIWDAQLARAVHVHVMDDGQTAVVGGERAQLPPLPGRAPYAYTYSMCKCIINKIALRP